MAPSPGDPATCDRTTSIKQSSSCASAFSPAPSSDQAASDCRHSRICCMAWINPAAPGGAPTIPIAASSAPSCGAARRPSASSGASPRTTPAMTARKVRVWVSARWTGGRASSARVLSSIARLAAQSSCSRSPVVLPASVASRACLVPWRASVKPRDGDAAPIGLNSCAVGSDASRACNPSWFAPTGSSRSCWSDRRLGGVCYRGCWTLAALLAPPGSAPCPVSGASGRCGSGIATVAARAGGSRS